MSNIEHAKGGRGFRAKEILSRKLPIVEVMRLLEGSIDLVSSHQVPPELVHTDPLRVKVVQTIINARGQDMEEVKKRLMGVSNAMVHDRRDYGKTHFEVRTWEETESGYNAYHINVYPSADEARAAGKICALYSKR